MIKLITIQVSARSNNVSLLQCAKFIDSYSFEIDEDRDFGMFKNSIMTDYRNRLHRHIVDYCGQIKLCYCIVTTVRQTGDFQIGVFSNDFIEVSFNFTIKMSPISCNQPVSKTAVTFTPVSTVLTDIPLFRAV
jgi:hypothetical protein